MEHKLPTRSYERMERRVVETAANSEQEMAVEGKTTPRGIVRRLQIGEAMPFAREQPSAINKYEVDKVSVIASGFIGDEQADSFFHGGCGQAVHQMPEDVYPLIRKEFPNMVAYEGMLGENLIVSEMNESNVCIGDIYQIGSVRVQVTRPRRPCWKIDSQFDQRGVAKFLQEQGCVGWYYSVLQTGDIQKGDACHLLERPHPFASLSRLWQIYNDNTFTDMEERDRWLAIDAWERRYKNALLKLRPIAPTP
ncbi:MOSC domain-containing protein [Burkholderia cenocepacia]|jgi:MOSC domain-containing protein YiiM|uniref:MOSC domain-containing protein n=1 Tax=Burkholderia cenocepacia TaxID=95486 RepID=UPI0004F6D288|nr:MOSC domain-containing protein [Burkholderia cenocepacia]AIO43621.1 MOSC domain protein [Burkholderia cepacia]KGC05153.1 MOSC domain protein [Burkholderia cepacia]MCG0577976.1 MOSC domain-containing protein [Burkholderia cenocepacia]MCW3524435.1 MOSC domain-containing protein [Burkholderia cenocepacia]MCW3614657.1 MOSC domain-containing protein [Burkholderia cenocepacia]